MQQNESKWHQWRKLGIGASDAPVVMGVSPWTTRYQLWEEKTGLKERDQSGNWATQRGHDLEPVARSMFELQIGDEFPPSLAVHKEFDYLRASLDGLNSTRNEILEIKCPGAADHATALEGRVPAKYYPQVQHQLMVTQASVCHYASFDGNSSLAVVEVRPDVEYIETLLEECHAFWALVSTMSPPELCDRDVKAIRDKELLALAKLYCDIDTKIKELEKEQKDIREKLTTNDKILEHARVNLGRLNITKTVRKGTIDYSAIDILKEIDLENFRKKGTSSLTFTISKA